MNWINIKDRKPDEGQFVFYFFEILGVYKGKYCKANYYEGHDDIEPLWGDCFYGEKGFLTDDVTHWMPAPCDSDWDGKYPDVPEGYVKLEEEGFFRQYAHKDDIITVRRDEYEGMKTLIEYLEAGHITGLVCPNCPMFHIYWERDYDGYYCNNCESVHDTKEIETNSYRYESKYDRPCPHCNPEEDYMNGFLEYTAGNEPYSTEHYICNKCDSTYCIGDI